MNKLTREDLLLFLKIAIVIAILIVAIKLFINFLPIIIILLIILIVLDSLKKNNKLNLTKKKKGNDIKEAEIISERKND